MVNIPFKSLFALLQPHVVVSYRPKSDNNAGGSRKFTLMCFGRTVPGLLTLWVGDATGNYQHKKSFPGVFL